MTGWFIALHVCAALASDHCTNVAWWPEPGGYVSHAACTTSAPTVSALITQGFAVQGLSVLVMSSECMRLDESV